MKIYLFFIAFSLSLGCLAQKRVVVKDFVSISIPAEFNIATKNSLMATNSEKKERTIVNDLIKVADAKYLYAINGITFYLNADNHQMGKNRPKELRDGFDEMARGLKNYNSRIVSNGDKTMLLINNGQFTNIFIYNKNFSKTLTGMFILDEGRDANKLVNKIYNSVNFDVGTIK